MLGEDYGGSEVRVGASAEMYAAYELILGGEGGLKWKGLLRTERGDFAVWVYEIWLCLPDARRDVR